MSKIFLEKEAGCWEEALPIGNGRLGAMVYGGVDTEHLQLNEDSIWYGKPIDRINPDASKYLDKIRELILGGKPDEAEKLLRYAFTATPNSERIYQPLGDVELQMLDKQKATKYRRILDLDTAVMTVDYDTDTGHMHREYFASAPAGVLVIHLESTDKLNFDLLLTREHFYDDMVMDAPDTVYLKGNLGKGGLDFAFGCKVKVQGGEVRRIGERLIVQGADAATLYLAGSSTFYESQLMEALEHQLRDAAQKSYEQLKEEHVADYQKLYGQVELTLPADSAKQQETTEKRLQEVKDGGEDPDLYKTYFDFGRYLLISSSRKGSMPANLQGIWNHRMMPPWESKYTININTEMNYWMAESCGLEECEEPVFALLERMRESGRKCAKQMYGCRGFMAHHNTDLWADTAPQDIYIPATYWPMGAAWLSTMIWKRYVYTRDRAHLEHYFPVLQEAVLFFMDFLVEDQGEMVTCPSVSPENTYRMENGVEARVCAGPAMDNEILRDLLEGYLKAEKVLDHSSEITEQVKQTLEKLPSIRIGRYGQIMEWREDYEETEPGHRHVSQLYALYPSEQINWEETPELARAAETTLDRRMKFGGGYTGWSAALMALLYAKVWRAETAYDMLKLLFRQSTFSTLMDNHPHVLGPVFQIDGNLGGCDAILKMLLQDDSCGEKVNVHLLAACPKPWSSGSLKGVRIKGNARLDMEWDLEQRNSLKVQLHAQSDWEGTLIWKNQRQKLSLKAGESRMVCFE